MFRNFIIAFIVLVSLSGFSQDNLSELLNKHNLNSVPYITVQELAMPKTQAVILDAREKAEFDVSHLKGAIFVGYTNFDLEHTTKKLNNKQQTIVVYCSLGIRSETIAHKLKKAGYTNVLNLYGGVFEWKNNNFKVYNSEEKETDNIHVYSKEWSKWLLKGNKVY